MKKHIIEVPDVEAVGVYAIHNKKNDKYYMKYYTKGTMCNWYCDSVMESYFANGGFFEQPYNNV